MFFTQPSFVGIEYSDTHLRIAALSKKGKGFKVVQLKEFPIEEGVKQLYNLPKGCVIATALSSSDVLVRSLEVQLKNQKQVLEALNFQIEPLLPFPIDEGIVLADSLEKHTLGTKLTTIVTRKTSLKKHLNDLASFDIHPEVVSALPLALASAATSLSPTPSPQLVVYIQESVAHAALVEKGALISARSFDIKEDFAGKIKRTALAFGAFDSVLYLGEDEELHKRLQASLEKPVLFPTPYRFPLSQGELAKYGCALGIALQAATRAHISFRKGSFSYPKPWKRVKWPLLTYVMLNTLCAALLVFGSAQKTKKQKEGLKKELSLLLDEEVLSAASLETPLDFERSIKTLEKAIASKPDTYPLLPGVPTPHDLIAWLSNHPSVKEKLSITSLHYTMVKRPSFSQKKERYQVKVDLEFTTEKSSDAKLFHEALLEENGLIDAQGELIWTAIKGKYKASFYLKDQTRYSA